MKQINLLVLVILSLALFTACNKDDEPAPTKTDFLTEKSWVATAITINPAVQFNDGTISGDLYARYNPCVKDDIKIFSRNGNYRAEEGDQKCNASDPQIFELGNWALSDNETKLVVTSNGQFSSYDIQELTATKLTYTYAIQLTEGGTTYTITETYGVQQ